MPLTAADSPRTLQLAIVALALVAVAALAGCDTIGQDLSGLSKTFNPTKPSEAGRMAVDPTDPDKRREGTTLLANAPFGGVDVYVKLYRDGVDNERDPIVKTVAIQALGKHGEPADAVRIAPHLTTGNDQVKWAAARALQRLHNPAVVPDLLRALANENEKEDIRIAVAQALAQYPEDRVFQGLVGALNARELAVNAAAEESLHTLTGQSFNMSAPDWLAWYGEAEKGHAAFASQREYLYPTYQRDLHWWEKIAFWSPKVWEQPAPPAGLRPEGGRGTYEDSAATTSSATQPATRRSTYGAGG